MSQENVELVTGLQPAPDVDIAALFRNEHMWSALVDAAVPFFHSDFESVAPGVPATDNAGAVADISNGDQAGTRRGGWLGRPRA
jgi:hypothetical protein